MKLKKRWKAFYLNGKRICAYTIEGTFDGEEQATKELLAFEHDTEPEKISVRILAHL